jgi:hypothetical protein
MLKILSDLNLVHRITKEYHDSVSASGVSGTWVTIDSDNKFIMTTATVTGHSYPIWNESNRDGTLGFTPDVAAITKVTVLFGKLRAVTDQVTDYASMAIGDPLVAVSGKLTKYTDGTDEEAVVAYCSRKIASLTHLGTTFTNVIEFWTR